MNTHDRNCVVVRRPGPSGRPGAAVKIRCWGARGSIPVSGPEYDRYGGDTSCVEVRARSGDILVLDAGTGIRSLGCELFNRGMSDITLLISHYHWDHIQGLPFLKLLYNPAGNLKIAGRRGAPGELVRVLRRVMRPPLFPILLDTVPANVQYLDFVEETLRVGSLTVRRIATSHPDKGAGFRIEEGGKALVYLTDNELAMRHRGGLAFGDYVEFCKGADLLIHDTEYSPEEYAPRRGWGHSHFGDAARLAMEAGVGTLGMFHHNQERTDAAQDQLLARCRALLAAPGAPACVALHQGWACEL